eukprot:gene28303-2905_t
MQTETGAKTADDREPGLRVKSGNMPREGEDAAPLSDGSSSTTTATGVDKNVEGSHTKPKAEPTTVATAGKDVKRASSTPPSARSSVEREALQQQSPYEQRERHILSTTATTTSTKHLSKQPPLSSTHSPARPMKRFTARSAESPTRPRHGRTSAKQVHSEAAPAAAAATARNERKSRSTTTASSSSPSTFSSSPLTSRRQARSADQPASSSRRSMSESPIKMVRSADPSGTRSRTRTRSVGAEGRASRESQGTLTKHPSARGSTTSPRKGVAISGAPSNSNGPDRRKGKSSAVNVPSPVTSPNRGKIVITLP